MSDQKQSLCGANFRAGALEVVFNSVFEGVKQQQQQYNITWFNSTRGVKLEVKPSVIVSSESRNCRCFCSSCGLFIVLISVEKIT